MPAKLVRVCLVTLYNKLSKSSAERRLETMSATWLDLLTIRADFFFKFKISFPAGLFTYLVLGEIYLFTGLLNTKLSVSWD